MDFIAPEIRIVAQAPSQAAYDTMVAAATHKTFTREQILLIEKFISEMPGAVFGDNDLTPVAHKFADGIYMREMFIPKGVVLSGAVQKFKIANFLMKGELLVCSEEFGGQKLVAPFHWISSPGAKRIACADEDTVVVTVHRSDRTDKEGIRETLMVDTYEEYDAFVAARKAEEIK